MNAEEQNGRQGVLIRAVTRAIEQKVMMRRLKEHRRFAGNSEEEILEKTRQDCLQGAWYLVDYRGYESYRPSENVVNIFSMGTLVTEALAASDELLKKGIYANVIQVSSPDLLLGNLAYQNGYQHLRENLGVNGDLYLDLRNSSAVTASDSDLYPPRVIGPGPSQQASFQAVAGRRVPIVSIHDGEPGLLDNIGSVIGTLQTSLAVRKHSKSGTPKDIYQYHGLDRESVVRAAEEMLFKSAFSEIRLNDETGFKTLKS